MKLNKIMKKYNNKKKNKIKQDKMNNKKKKRLH